MLAAMKPNMWNAFGRSAKVNAVTSNPVSEAVPNFLVHHVASVNVTKPNMSHVKGRWVICQTIGANVRFKAPQKAVHIIIATMSRVLK